MMRHKSFPFEVKAMTDDAQTFEGYASVFGVVDRVGDIVVPGAFAKRLAEFMQTGIVLFNHDRNQVIGSPMEAREDEKGLWFKATIEDTPKAQEIRTLMKRGVIKQASFAYDIIDAEKLTAGNIGKFCDPQMLEPRQLEEAFRWGYALKELEVLDISPVSIAACRETDITDVKGGSGGRPFDDRSVAVLATVKDWVQALEDIRDLRDAKGKGLSEEHRARMTALLSGVDNLQAQADRLKALLEESDPLRPTREAEQAHARFLEIQARALAAT